MHANKEPKQPRWVVLWGIFVALAILLLLLPFGWDLLFLKSTDKEAVSETLVETLQEASEDRPPHE